MTIHRGYLLGTVAIGALLAGTFGASAGGFALREQSASSQGASFAGNGANNDLSAMFWNPAAAANKTGTNSESHYSLIVPHAELTVTSAQHPTSAALNGALGAAGNNSGDIGSLALLGASYFSYQFRDFDPNFFLGFAMNSPFGLKTNPDKDFQNYKGAVVGRESKLLTMNFNPTLGYRLSSTFSVGVGAQFQYGSGRFSFATGGPAGNDSRFEGTGMAVGATAGIMWRPTPSTTVGLGWRSQISQNLDGAYINTTPTSVVGLRTVDAHATIELPNVVTLSLRQGLTSNTRLLGTVEWAQWSRFKELRLTADAASSAETGVLVPTTSGGATVGTIPGQVIGTLAANWTDSWFFALGGEYDVNRQLTVRAGGAYEISPIDDPRKRLIGIPDNDRIWGSLGATYKWSELTSFDFAYTHLFVKDSTFNRDSLSGINVIGNVSASTDIVSMSLKTKW